MGQLREIYQILYTDLPVKVDTFNIFVIPIIISESIFSRMYLKPFA